MRSKTSAERPMTLREFFENTWQDEHADEVFSAAANVATRAAITAHTKALIEGAGDVERELIISTAQRTLGGEQCFASVPLLSHAAATIAAQKAEIERLTERAAQAKLDGVMAGIEAAAYFIQELGPSDDIGNWEAAGAIRAFDAEAIAKGEG